MRVRITSTMAEQYMDRCPEGIPERLKTSGDHDLDEAEAREVRADAEFMADAKNGPEIMSIGLRSAYRALARQFQSTDR